MQRFRNIVVGVDLAGGERLAAAELSPANEEAVHRAIWLASKLSAELTFFAALDVSAHVQEMLHDEFAKVSETVEDVAQADLDKLVERARQQNVTAHSRLAFGSPWVETVKQVLRDKHDLCIVGTRNVGAAQRLLFGTTGSKLLRNCPCPVWVTKPDPDFNDLNILVPSDFSDVSSLALELAVNVGKLVDTRIHLLHALKDRVENRLWYGSVSDEKLNAFHSNQRNEALQTLHNQLAKTDYRTLEQGVQVHVIDGPSDVVILNAIEEFHIDLIVMGTIARAGLPGMLVGNTAERLLSHVPCSIVALKPEGWKCPITAD